MTMPDPSGLPIVGPGTPYITPAILTAAPTGISWSTIPDRGSTVDQQYSELVNICMRSTAAIDEYCNQPLRATINTDQLTGPGDFRVQVQPNGVTRLLLTRFPVTKILAGQMSPAAAFPRAWTPIPANQWDIEVPLDGVYGTTAPGSSGSGGQAVLLAPGYGGWFTGRQSNLYQVQYINGWPHAGLTAASDAGSTTLAVDDITGWIGAVGVVYGGALQEAVVAAAVAPDTPGALSGPGTLTLGSPLRFAHQAGDIVTTLPASVIQAGILFSTMQALTRGATSTAVQSLAGGTNSGGGASPDALQKWAQSLINPYKRRL